MVVLVDEKTTTAETLEMAVRGYLHAIKALMEHTEVKQLTMRVNLGDRYNATPRVDALGWDAEDVLRIDYYKED